MNFKTFSLIMLILIFNRQLSSHSQPKHRQCIFATKSKPIGRFDYLSGYTISKPYKWSRFDSKEVCNDKCREDDKCWATSINTIQMNCSFYNDPNIYVKTDANGLVFSIWKICNMSDGYQPDDGRCLGLWVTYKYKNISVHNYNSIQTFHLQIDACREECLKDSLCGFANFGDINCVLIPKWPYQNLERSDNQSYNIEEWTCVDNYIERLEIPKKTFKPMDEKCTGHWEIVSRNENSDEQNITSISFQTQAFKDCLDECNQYKNCLVALYNVTYSICVLPSISPRETEFPFKNTTFIKFEWKCDTNDSYHPQRNEEEKRYSSLGMKCRRIISNKGLFIGKDDCGKYPSESKFVRCTYSVTRDAFDGPNLKDSCKVNQSYWSFNEKILPLNLTGNEQMKVTKIFTGLTIYWLAYEDNNILGEVDYVECRSFDASMSRVKLLKNEIVPRSNWRAFHSKGPMNHYDVIPSFFCISASQYPYHTCKTEAACIDTLRNLQVLYFHGTYNTVKFSDIPFNFMINGNGDIYECRGWNYQCAAVAGYNPISLCIGYIGWFQNELPNEKVVKAMKSLIEYAVANGHLDKNYRLFIQQDLGTSKVHKNLVNVIRNWYRYRGFIPENCKNYSLLNIGLCGLLILIVCVIIYAFFTRLEFRQFCDKCKFLDCQEIIFHQIYPHEIMLDTIDDDLTTYNCSTNYCIISKKSTVFAKANQSKTVKLIKIWFFNQFLETMNARRHVNSLGNYLNSFPHLKGNSFVYEIERGTHKNESDYEKIILCVNNEKVFKEFQRLSKMKHCICNLFILNSTDLTSAAVDVLITK